MTLGIEINANHMRAMTEGPVTGTCKPLQLGRTLHVWEIRITDTRDRTLLCESIDRDGEETIGMSLLGLDYFSIFEKIPHHEKSYYLLSPLCCQPYFCFRPEIDSLGWTFSMLPTLCM